MGKKQIDQGVTVETVGDMSQTIDGYCIKFSDGRDMAVDLKDMLKEGCPWPDLPTPMGKKVTKQLRNVTDHRVMIKAQSIPLEYRVLGIMLTPILTCAKRLTNLKNITGSRRQQALHSVFGGGLKIA